MGPWTAIRTCFRKSFRGRARRAEYWWFALFFVTVIAVLVICPIPGIAGFALLLAVFLPLFAVGARRMHDIGRPGALYLIGPAITTGFAKSFQVKGRASRPEFWWFTAFATLMAALVAFADMALFPTGLGHKAGVPEHIVAPLIAHPLSWLAVILLAPASLCVAIRRLHDSNLSAAALVASVVSVLAYAGLYQWTFQQAQPVQTSAFASVEELTADLDATSDRLDRAAPALRALAWGSMALQILLLLLCLRPSSPHTNRFGPLPAGGPQ